MEDQDRDHISSRSHFSGRSDQELDEMLDELRAGKIGINQPGQNSSEHDSEDTPEENDNASGTGNAAKSKKGKSRKEGFNLKDEVISWIQVLVAAAIIAFCVNHFIIANSEVPTSSMETTIMAGDRVIGSRLSYKFGDPQRGDIAIFIYPDDEAKGIKTYYVKRIIGMPGDTILVSNDGYEVNGKLLPHSPRSLNTYFITQKGADDFLKILQKLNIPVRNWKNETFGFSFSLTTFEEYQLREELTEEMNIHFIRNQAAPYKLVVPRKGRAYRLDEAALTACKEAILAEAGEKVAFRDGKLYLDGRETTFFFFEQDYYWMLSDNVNESVDSRHLGFIPRDRIIGNAWFCWFSRDKQRIFKPVN